MHNRIRALVLGGVLAGNLAGVFAGAVFAQGKMMGVADMNAVPPRQNREQITLGGGCFWCLEAVFDELEGVESVESGYSGGHVPDPSYTEVCAGETGHAEVVQITFDPAVITLTDLLRVYFTIHDPTTLNRQGADHGTQYRSVIFYQSPEQKRVAEQVTKEITDQKIWDDPIVTQLTAFEAFYKAEDYHQEYYAGNANQPYCRVVIAPKVAKFREHFRDRLKKKP